jgi:hypothetical protein
MEIRQNQSALRAERASEVKLTGYLYNNRVRFLYDYLDCLKYPQFILATQMKRQKLGL